MTHDGALYRHHRARTLVEECPVPEGLFDLADPAERQRLEAKPLTPS